MNKILIVQPASIGDVVLTTPLIENLHHFYPNAQIDFFMRVEYVSLLENHPYLHHIYTWHKKKNKYKNLFRLIKSIQKERYDLIVNVQRHFSSGLVLTLSKAGITSGFNKNPLSLFFTHVYKHVMGVKGQYIHEVDRNLLLISFLDKEPTIRRPVLHPHSTDYEKVKPLKSKPYICIAPSSLWYTKRLPTEKWIALIDAIPDTFSIYLLGSKADRETSSYIVQSTQNKNVKDLCGDLSLLESTALIDDAAMVYANDSAVMHIASAMNTPTTATFLSTALPLGYGPMADDAIVVETKEDLSCKPCGFHGYHSCPKKHFKCGLDIDVQDLIRRIPTIK